MNRCAQPASQDTARHLKVPAALLLVQLHGMHVGVGPCPRCWKPGWSSGLLALAWIADSRGGRIEGENIPPFE